MYKWYDICSLAVGPLATAIFAVAVRSLAIWQIGIRAIREWLLGGRKHLSKPFIKAVYQLKGAAQVLAGQG